MTDDMPKLPIDLGAKRTVMAADRTLMAWIRTSLSMLSFGFTIYKFLDAATEKTGHGDSESPQHIGLFLAGMGTLAILLGTWGYWMTLSDLKQSNQFHLGRPVLLMALIMCIAGIGLFAAIATRAV
ncbi:YidH family protein [Sphingobium scionense]|jgi:putative membrane protein